MPLPRFGSWTLRKKIILGYLFPLIPIVLVVFINFYAARNNSLETAWRLMELSTKSCSEKLNIYFRTQASQFLSWTDIDVFGMAIEFDALDALGNQFKTILEGAPDFCLLMITDSSGKVLKAAGKSSGTLPGPESLHGRMIADLPQKDDYRMRIVKTDLFPGLDRTLPYTALYSYRTRDSSGQPNGFFLACLDWSGVQAMIDGVHSEMRRSGFTSARVRLVETYEDLVVGASKAEPMMTRSRDRVPTEFIVSLEPETVSGIVTSRGAEYILASPVRMALNDQPGEQDSNSQTHGYLTVLVTRADILARVRKVFIAAVSVAVIGGAIFLLICLLLTRSISRPMGQLVHVLEQYGNGDMTVRASLDTTDEIGFFAQKFNLMLDQINESAQTLQESESKFRRLFNQLQESINTGNYALRFPQESDSDDLPRSLNRMLQTLQDADNTAISQDWLKSGQTGLNSIISGKRNMDDLAREGLGFIARYVSAQVGTCYVWEPDTDTYVLSAHYAFAETGTTRHRVKPGEGIPGQAALEKERILVDNVPGDAISIESFLGRTLPRAIVASPLIYEDNTLGIIELGSLTKFTPLHLEFIDIAARAMGVAISAALFNAKLQALLDQTRLQSRELEAQQEELKTTNEELSEQAAMLEEQAATLQESELKLQNHQVELQASNQELEEKTELLEAQKKEIETKNRSLQQKQLELEENARQLELATAYKSEFLANMSHELRTPLNSMLLLAKMLADNEEANLTADQVESAESIHRSGHKLLHLINDILDLSKIEANRIELSISRLSLHAFAAGLEKEFLHVAKEKNLDFKVSVMDGLPDTITSDLYRLEQIIRNFIGNAVKFTESGSVTLTISRPGPDFNVEECGLDRDRTIAVSVADTGPGIPKDQLDLIFEAFKQVDGSISRRYGGTGLGLSIARRLADLVQGTIKAVSTSGKGSVFTLLIPESIDISRLPATHPRSGSRPGESEANPKMIPGTRSEKNRNRNQYSRNHSTTKKAVETSGTDTKTLLIIEDDREFATVLASFFRKHGYRTIIAADGEQGIQRIFDDKPTAVILDMGLPGIDGWTVLDELKNNPDTRHIPVHIISGMDNTEKGLLKGAVGYLTKPVSFPEMTQVLNRIEHVLSRDVKEMLIVENDEATQRSIQTIMDTRDIHTVIAATGQEALSLLQRHRFDCIVLDPALPDITGFELLDHLSGGGFQDKTPVIVFSRNGLTPAESETLKHYSSTLALKSAQSMERLLDETALFLHRVESRMPDNHRKMIQKIRDRESILAGKKVLMVDDDMRSAFALRKFLKSRGMDVTIANNGEKALELLEKDERPDIILMDIMMPVMDGYEAMGRIREQEAFRNLPILALTAKAMDQDREKCIRCGASDYMSKPVDTSKLLAMLRVWLYS